MSSGVVTLFKYVFLAVLYLFFLRVLRAVWVELREPKAAAVVAAPHVATHAAPPTAAPDPAAPDPAAPAPPAPGRRRRGRADPTHLRVVEPPERAGQTFPLAEELTVGRAAGCGVALPEDTFTSQLHARIFRRDGDVWVEDLGSTNGTLLNDRKVSAPAVIRRGDRLQVGRTVLELAS